MKNNTEFEKLRFPIEKFEKHEVISDKQLKLWISDIELFPVRLKRVFSGLKRMN